jgi:excisionase family DNA binding protein
VASTVRPERRALSVDEFATAWGVSASTVRRAIDERRIPAMRLTVGGSIRIPADATPPVD